MARRGVLKHLLTFNLFTRTFSQQLTTNYHKVNQPKVKAKTDALDLVQLHLEHDCYKTKFHYITRTTA
jgi:hypothetical protein